jgi:hypothetical protein
MRLLLAVVLALLTGSISEAQTDSVKALIGKWEGEVQLRGVGGDQNRTLIIESVGEKDGKLVAEGRYGITGKGLGKIQIEVDTTGRWPSIRFVTSANTTVRLNLVDERSMVGTMTLPGTREGGSDRSVKLARVN